jgi:hypothetical protein
MVMLRAWPRKVEARSYFTPDKPRVYLVSIVINAQQVGGGIDNAHYFFVPIPMNRYGAIAH